MRASRFVKETTDALTFTSKTIALFADIPSRVVEASQQRREAPGCERKSSEVTRLASNEMATQKTFFFFFLVENRHVNVTLQNRVHQ